MATKSTKKPAKKTTKKAVKKAAPRKQPVVKFTDELPDEKMEQRRIALEEACKTSGVDPSTVTVFYKEYLPPRETPISIALAGTGSDGVFFVEVFQCLDELPAGVHTDLLLLDGQKLTVATENLTRVLRASIVPDQKARYERLLYDPTTAVDLGQIAAAAAHLIEEYTGRPTMPSTD